MIRYTVLLAVTLLLTVSCSGDSGAETAQVATLVTTATAMPATPTPHPIPTVTPMPIATATGTPATPVPPTPTARPTPKSTPVPPTPTLTPKPKSTPVPPTPTLTPKPKSTPVPPTPTPKPTLVWPNSCGNVAVKTSYAMEGSKLKWTFGSNPNLRAMFVRTRPSRHVSESKGFGVLSLQQFEIAVTDSLSYEYELINPSGHQLEIDVELVTEHQGGTGCISKMYRSLPYPEESQVTKDLVIPSGLAIDYDKYSDIDIPAPTLESLIQAFAVYDAGGHGDGPPDYDKWKMGVGEESGIRDYDPKLGIYLFGDGADEGDWQTARLILEIINAIKPSLEPRFVTTIDEVTLPQIHSFCETWMASPYYFKHCRPNGNAALFSDAPVRKFPSSRGYNWYQSRMVHEYDDRGLYKYEPGDSYTNPCCSINFHEIGHGFGLNHTYCAHSSVSRWEDRAYMTKIWNQDDLAAIAVHLDTRTKHGMTVEQAADALGIDKDDRYYEMIEKPWLACGNQDPGWDKLAGRIYEEYVKSGYAETQHPDNRDSVQFVR